MINNALAVCISTESLNIHKKMFRKPQTGYINIGLLCKSRNTYKLVSSCYAEYKLRKNNKINLRRLHRAF